MKLRPLAIGPEERKVVAALMKAADEHRLDRQDLYNIMEGLRPPPGDEPVFVCVLPFGYRCVYTVENHPAGWCRHLSVSVEGDGDAPNPAAVLLLMDAFGFNGGFREMTNVSKEQLDGNKIAINIMQKL
jgi:hypothetical protein